MPSSEPIRRVTFSRNALRFPARCLDCGGAPDGDHALSHKAGPLRLELKIPICKACASGRTRRRLRWYAATIGVMVAWMAVIAVLQEGGILSPRSPVFPILAGLFAVYAIAWYAGETAIFHARYSRIWIAGFERETVTLASRDEALLRSIEGGGGVVGDGKG